MYEDTLYGGFYTVTGKNRRYIFIAGTDENDNVVTGRVPKEEFYKWYKKSGVTHKEEMRDGNNNI